MPVNVRKGFDKKARVIVVKAGSAMLTKTVEGRGRTLDMAMFKQIARQIDELMREGRKVVLVSSGAMAAGSMLMGRGALPNRIPEKQAWAAIGQPRLMRHYEEAFQPMGRPVGQVLLTHDDLRHRSRYLNSKRTLVTLMEIGAVPIINENDTVAVEEIKVGDNDTLSAQVAAIVEADLLVILTTVDGLLKDGKVVPSVPKIDKKIVDLAGGPGSSIGIGGMVTKIEAARLAGSLGIPTVIAPGRKPDVLKRIISGSDEGTLFMPDEQRLKKRKHWIAWTQKPRGEVVVDDGAANALLKQGKSLLPKGVVETRGSFDRGEAVKIINRDGVEIARGIVQYSSADLSKIKGLHSKDIENTLGYRFEDEAVHRDDLAISGRE